MKQNLMKILLYLINFIFGFFSILLFIYIFVFFQYHNQEILLDPKDGEVVTYGPGIAYLIFLILFLIFYIMINRLLIRKIADDNHKQIKICLGVIIIGVLLFCLLIFL